jgi:hypothetical protein
MQRRITKQPRWDHMDRDVPHILLCAEYRVAFISGELNSRNVTDYTSIPSPVTRLLGTALSLWNIF